MGLSSGIPSPLGRLISALLRSYLWALGDHRAGVRNFRPSSHPILICRRDCRAGVGRYRGRRSGLKIDYRNYFYRLMKKEMISWSICSSSRAKMPFRTSTARIAARGSIISCSSLWRGSCSGSRLGGYHGDCCRHC